MCYSIMYAQQWSKLQKSFDLSFDESFPSQKMGERVFPFKETYVLTHSGENTQLQEMRYSLTPSWSETSKVKWSTYNARLTRAKGDTIERIYEVPTWRESFGSKHCVVPITHFFESCYDGLAAGHEVAFQGLDHETLFCAGIYSHWQGEEEEPLPLFAAAEKSPSENPFFSKTEFRSFAIITTEPTPYIEEVGHDRMPVFLNIKSAKEWLAGFSSPETAFDFILNNSIKPELSYEPIRRLVG